MIRRGINTKNKEYWRDEIFIGYQGLDKQTAEIKADLVCHQQEIERLRSRIIKLEKRKR